VNELDDYLRANRDSFTREALTRRLVDEGHDPADVEAAWARIKLGEAIARPGPVERPGRAGIGTFLLIGLVVVAYGYVTFLGFAGIGFMAYYGPIPAAGPNPAASILSAVYAIAMLVGLGYSVRRLYRAPSLAAGGSAIGAAFGIAALVLVGINGGCIAGALAGSAVGAF
jgi:hypothetical protein